MNRGFYTKSLFLGIEFTILELIITENHEIEYFVSPTMHPKSMIIGFKIACKQRFSRFHLTIKKQQ
jgi:hypothetical protein